MSGWDVSSTPSWGSQDGPEGPSADAPAGDAAQDSSSPEFAAQDGHGFPGWDQADRERQELAAQRQAGRDYRRPAQWVPRALEHRRPLALEQGDPAQEDPAQGGQAQGSAPESTAQGSAPSGLSRPDVAAAALSAAPADPSAPAAPSAPADGDSPLAAPEDQPAARGDEAPGAPDPGVTAFPRRTPGESLQGLPRRESRGRTAGFSGGPQPSARPQDSGFGAGSVFTRNSSYSAGSVFTRNSDFDAGRVFSRDSGLTRDTAAGQNGVSGPGSAAGAGSGAGPDRAAGLDRAAGPGGVFRPDRADDPAGAPGGDGFFSRGNAASASRAAADRPGERAADFSRDDAAGAGGFFSRGGFSGSSAFGAGPGPGRRDSGDYGRRGDGEYSSRNNNGFDLDAAARLDAAFGQDSAYGQDSTYGIGWGGRAAAAEPSPSSRAPVDPALPSRVPAEPALPPRTPVDPALPSRPLAEPALPPRTPAEPALPPRTPVEPALPSRAPADPWAAGGSSAPAPSPSLSSPAHEDQPEWGRAAGRSVAPWEEEPGQSPAGSGSRPFGSRRGPAWEFVPADPDDPGADRAQADPARPGAFGRGRAKASASTRRAPTESWNDGAAELSPAGGSGDSMAPSFSPAAGGGTARHTLRTVLILGGVFAVVIAVGVVVFTRAHGSSSPTASTSPSSSARSSTGGSPSASAGSSAGSSASSTGSGAGGSHTTTPAATLSAPSMAGGYPVASNPGFVATAKTEAKRVLAGLAGVKGATVHGGSKSAAYQLPVTGQVATFVGWQGAFSPARLQQVLSSLGTDAHLYPAGTLGGGLGCYNTVATKAETSGAVCVWVDKSTLGITEFFSATGPEALTSSQGKGAANTVNMRADIEHKA